MESKKIREHRRNFIEKNNKREFTLSKLFKVGDVVKPIEKRKDRKLFHTCDGPEPELDWPNNFTIVHLMESNSVDV